MSFESVVLSRAALIFGTTEEKIKETATAKRGPASDARSAVILVLRNDAERSHEEIARLLGYADFGCARQAYYAARNKRLRLPVFSDLVERLSDEAEREWMRSLVEHGTDPGSGTDSMTAPTKAEREWMRSIVEHGCIVCALQGHEGTPASVHHLTYRGRRLGHLFTIPLCHGHHQVSADGKFAYHDGAHRFEATYGTQQSLLAQTRKRVGWSRHDAVALWLETESLKDAGIGIAMDAATHKRRTI